MHRVPSRWARWTCARAEPDKAAYDLYHRHSASLERAQYFLPLALTGRQQPDSHWSSLVHSGTQRPFTQANPVAQPPNSHRPWRAESIHVSGVSRSSSPHPHASPAKRAIATRVVRLNTCLLRHRLPFALRGSNRLESGCWFEPRDSDGLARCSSGEPVAADGEAPSCKCRTALRRGSAE